MCAATSVAGSILISFPQGGDATAILGTPATLAGTVTITETEG